MPIGGLGIIGLSFGARGIDSALGPECVQLRPDPRRQFRSLRQHHPLHRRAADDRAVGADDSARGSAARRVLHADAVLHRRDDDDGHGNGSADDLHRARDPLDCGLRAHRAAPGLAAVDRSGVQILPAWRIRERVLPVRYGADLRAHGLDPARPHRHVDGRRRHARHADDAVRCGHAPGRLLPSRFGRAVPHVDAGCLRRRADRRRRFHVNGSESRGIRGVRPRLPVGLRADARRLGPGVVGAGHPHHARRHHRRRRADQSEAHARVLEHRPRRIPPRWSGRRQ